MQNKLPFLIYTLIENGFFYIYFFVFGFVFCSCTKYKKRRSAPSEGTRRLAEFLCNFIILTPTVLSILNENCLTCILYSLTTLVFGKVSSFGQKKIIKCWQLLKHKKGREKDQRKYLTFLQIHTHTKLSPQKPSKWPFNLFQSIQHSNVFNIIYRINMTSFAHLYILDDS